MPCADERMNPTYDYQLNECGAVYLNVGDGGNIGEPSPPAFVRHCCGSFFVPAVTCVWCMSLRLQNARRGPVQGLRRRPWHVPRPQVRPVRHGSGADQSLHPHRSLSAAAARLHSGDPSSQRPCGRFARSRRLLPHLAASSPSPVWARSDQAVSKVTAEPRSAKHH